MLRTLSIYFNESNSEHGALKDHEFVMTEIIHHPRVTPDFARDYILQPLEVFRSPYGSRARLLTLLVNSRKLSQEEKDYAINLIKMYSNSESLFNALRNVERGSYFWVRSKEVVNNAIHSDSDAPYLVETVRAWISKEAVPVGVQSDVVLELARHTEQILRRRTKISNLFVMRVLSELTEFQTFLLSQSVLQELASVILSHTTESSFSTAWIRYKMGSRLLFNFDSNKNWPVAGTQWILERLMEKILAPMYDSNSPNRVTNRTTVEMILGTLQSCYDQNYQWKSADFRREICAKIPSPTKIYAIIASNSNIDNDLRELALRLKNSP